MSFKSNLCNLFEPDLNKFVIKIGEGNGNPLQYSCLENPRDGGAWWAAIYGVAQSRTRLKQPLKSAAAAIKIMKQLKGVKAPNCKGNEQN